MHILNLTCTVFPSYVHRIHPFTAGLFWALLVEKEPEKKEKFSCFLMGTALDVLWFEQRVRPHDLQKSLPTKISLWFYACLLFRRNCHFPQTCACYALCRPMLIVFCLQARAAVLWDFRALVPTEAAKSKVAVLPRQQCICICIVYGVVCCSEIPCNTKTWGVGGEMRTGWQYS